MNTKPNSFEQELDGVITKSHDQKIGLFCIVCTYPTELLGLPREIGAAIAM